jgi:GNAT superfamily N-acetyltransferase
MVVERVRHALLAEIGALEDLQRRSSMIWEDYRDDLRRHPEAIEVPAGPVLERRVRVAIGDDGCVFGFCTVVPLGDDVGDLAALFVEPQYMGRGVGRKLIDDAVAIARGQGVRRLEVTANPRAVGFYEKVGFTSGAVVRTRFGPALRMHLCVPG